MPDPIGFYNAASQWYGGPGKQFYPGQTTANLNQNQTGGWMDAYNAANQVSGMGQGMLDEMGGVMGDMRGFVNEGAGLDPRFMEMMTADEINNIQGNFEVSPYVNDQVNAYQDSFNRGFQRSLPQYSTDAMQAGQMGSSRHGISEGLARSDFQRQLGEGTAALTNQAWQQAAQNAMTSRGQTLNALGQDRGRGTNAAIADANQKLSAWQMVPGAMNAYSNAFGQAGNAMMAPSGIRTNFGTLQQQTAQNQINGERERWDFYQNQPGERLSQYGNMLGGMGNYPQGQIPNTGSPIASGLQGAGVGMQIGNAFGGGSGGAPVGSNSNDWMPGGNANLASSMNNWWM